jgi:hypothetical protein
MFAQEFNDHSLVDRVDNEFPKNSQAMGFGAPATQL